MAWDDCSEALREVADAIDREGPLIAEIAEAARELLDAYVEENGGDMPTNEGHPARRLKAALDRVDGREVTP